MSIANATNPVTPVGNGATLVYTMVMRTGLPKASTNEMVYTLIGQDYSVLNMTGTDLVSAIAAKKISIINMATGPKGLVSTNGALDNYTLINSMTNSIEGKAKAVILNRIESNGKLVGYTIFNAAGTLQEIDIATAVAMYNSIGFSNGKIRHTQDGDIISAIGGTYPLRPFDFKTVKSEDASKALDINIVFIGSAVGESNKVAKYAGLLITSKNAASLAKIYPSFVENNKKIISAVKAISNSDETTKSLEMIRTGSAGFYGVFSIDKCFELIKRAKFKMPTGKINIACVDYSSDSNGDETRVIVDKDLKIIGKEGSSVKAAKVLKGYAEEVIKNLKDANSK